MSQLSDDEVQRAWRQACEDLDVEAWVEYLDRKDLADHLGFLETVGATQVGGETLPLHQWVDAMMRLRAEELLFAIRNPDASIQSRLAAATLSRWRTLIERLLLDSADLSLPLRGVVQYFGDQLALSVLLSYRRTGSAVEIGSSFAIPNPTALADPLVALGHVQNSEQLALLRSSLYSRHKIVILRNVLVHVDREQAEGVFGPSIDTLLLADWLFDERFSGQRTPENAIHFEDAMTKPATALSAENGTRFLEVGCGNGLLTACFAKNEAMIKQYSAIDVSMEAVSVTYLNSAQQRMLHRGSIGGRGAYIVAPYSCEIVPNQNDLVVCNPPYIPLPKDSVSTAQRLHGVATVGTELLASVIADAPRLLSEAGEMIFIASELANPEILAAVPDGWTCVKKTSRSVPFRVDSMEMDRDAHWLEWLSEERGLERMHGEIEGYVHSVAIYSISRNLEN